MALRVVAAVVLLASATAAAAVQFPGSDLRLERFLSAASERTGEYFGLFKDLTAEETKTVEVYKSTGDVARRRRIVSEFVVYQSLLDNASVAEYRNVIAVDGVEVANRQQRVAAVLAKSAKASSIREELKRVTRDGSRFDLDHTVSGLTITQGLPLQPWARPFFNFTVERIEQVAGRRTLVIAYQQTAPNPNFGFKLSLPDALDGSGPLYRGRLWLDSETASVMREEREVTVRDRATGRPVAVQRAEFAFAASRFGMPLPSRIDFVSLMRFQERPDGVVSAPLFRIVFEYGPFKQFTASSDDVVLAPTESAGDDAEAAAQTAPAPATPEAPAPDPALGPEFSPDFSPEAALAEARARELERRARERLGEPPAASLPPASEPPPPLRATTTPGEPARSVASRPEPAPKAPADAEAPAPDPSLGPEFSPDFSAEDALVAAKARPKPARVAPPTSRPSASPAPVRSDASANTLASTPRRSFDPPASPPPAAPPVRLRAPATRAAASPAPAQLDGPTPGIASVPRRTGEPPAAPPPPAPRMVFRAPSARPSASAPASVAALAGGASPGPVFEPMYSRHDALPAPPSAPDALSVARAKRPAPPSTRPASVSAGQGSIAGAPVSTAAPPATTAPSGPPAVTDPLRLRPRPPAPGPVVTAPVPAGPVARPVFEPAAPKASGPPASPPAAPRLPRPRVRPPVATRAAIPSPADPALAPSALPLAAPEPAQADPPGPPPPAGDSVAPPMPRQPWRPPPS